MLFFATLGVMVVMKTLGGEQHVAIKAYKFATFEILRFLVSYVYCMPMLSLHIESTHIHTSTLTYIHQYWFYTECQDGFIMSNINLFV